MKVLLKSNVSKELKQVLATVEVGQQQVTVQSPKQKMTLELVDVETGLAPESINVKRVQNHLEIFIDEDDVADLILENYYEQDDVNPLIGLAKDGHYYAYIPESGLANETIHVLTEGILATEVLAGEPVTVTGWISGFEGNVAKTWLGASTLAFTTVALALHDGDDSPAKIESVISTTEPPTITAIQAMDTSNPADTTPEKVRVTGKATPNSEVTINIKNNQNEVIGSATVKTGETGDYQVTINLDPTKSMAGATVSVVATEAGKTASEPTTTIETPFGTQTASVPNLGAKPTAVALDNDTDPSATTIALANDKNITLYTDKDGDQHKVVSEKADDGRYTLNNTAQPTVPTTDNANGAVKVDLSTLKTGESIKQIYTDEQGNKKAVEVEKTDVGYKLTEIAPTQPILTAQRNGDVLIELAKDAKTSTISYTDENGNKVSETLTQQNGVWTAPAGSPIVINGNKATLPATVTKVGSSVVAVSKDEYGYTSDEAVATAGNETALTDTQISTPSVTDITAKDRDHNGTIDTLSIQGKAEAGATVTVKDANGNTLGTTTADEQGNFSLEVANRNDLSRGEPLSVTAEKAGKTSQDTAIVEVPALSPTVVGNTLTTPKESVEDGSNVVVKVKDKDGFVGNSTQISAGDNTAPKSNEIKTPSITAITPNDANNDHKTDSVTVSGTTEPNAEVTVRNEQGEVIATGKADEKGVFNVSVNEVQAGDKLTVSAEKEGKTSQNTAKSEVPSLGVSIQDNKLVIPTETTEQGSAIQNQTETADGRTETSQTTANRYDELPTNETATPKINHIEATDSNKDGEVDGAVLGGTAEPNAKITIYNENNEVIGAGVADEKGVFSIPTSQPIQGGEGVQIIAQSNGKTVSSVPAKVTVPNEMPHNASNDHIGDQQAPNEPAFQPSENGDVKAILPTDSDIKTVVFGYVDENGNPASLILEKQSDGSWTKNLSNASVEIQTDNGLTQVTLPDSMVKDFSQVTAYATDLAGNKSKTVSVTAGQTLARNEQGEFVDPTDNKVIGKEKAQAPIITEITPIDSSNPADDTAEAVRISGTTTPHAEVAIQIGEETVTTQADADGKFTATISAPTTGGFPAETPIRVVAGLTDSVTGEKQEGTDSQTSTATVPSVSPEQHIGDTTAPNKPKITTQKENGDGSAEIGIDDDVESVEIQYTPTGQTEPTTIILTKQPDNSYQSSDPAVIAGIPADKNPKTVVLDEHKVADNSLVTVTVSDKAGNRETTSATVGSDSPIANPNATTEVPQITDITAKNTAGRDTEPTKLVLEGTSEPNAVITLTDKQGKTLGTATADQEGNFSLTIDETDTIALNKGDQLNLSAKADNKGTSPAVSLTVPAVTANQAPDLIDPNKADLTEAEQSELNRVPTAPKLAISDDKADGSVTFTLPQSTEENPIKAGDKVIITYRPTGESEDKQIILTKQADGSWKSSDPLNVPHIKADETEGVLAERLVENQSKVTAYTQNGSNPAKVSESAEIPMTNFDDRSRTPNIDNVQVIDSSAIADDQAENVIVSGRAKAGAEVEVTLTLPTGETLTGKTTAGKDGQYSVDIPTQGKEVTGATVSAIATEENKAPSKANTTFNDDRPALVPTVGQNDHSGDTTAPPVGILTAGKVGDGSVKITLPTADTAENPPAQGDKQILTITPPVNSSNSTPIEVTLTRDENGNWLSSHPDLIANGKDGETLTIDENNVDDGATVTLKAIDLAGNQTPENERPSVIANQDSPAQPVVTPRHTGAVAVQAGKDNDSLTIRYTDQTSDVEPKPTKVVVAKVDEQGNITALYAGILPEGQADELANYIADERQPIVATPETADRVPSISNDKKSVELPAELVADETPVEAMGGRQGEHSPVFSAESHLDDQTPNVADVAIPTAENNGDVSIAVGLDNNRVTIRYTPTGATQPSELVASKSDENEWTFQKDGLVLSNSSKVVFENGNIVLKAGEVADYTEVTAVGQVVQTSKIRQSQADAEAKRAISKGDDHTPETADAPTATAKPNGDITIAKGGDNKEVAVAYTDNSGAKQTITAKIDPTTGNWKLEPQVEDTVATINPTTGEITLKADAVKDGTEVSATGRNNAGKTSPATDTAKAVAGVADSTPETADAPTATAQTNGDVTIAKGGDNKAVAVTYTDNSGAKQTITAKIDPTTGNWKLEPQVEDTVATINPTTGEITLKANSVKDGTEVSATGSNNAGKTSPVTDTAKAVAGVADSTPETADKPQLSAHHNGDVEIDKGGDNKQVEVSFTPASSATTEPKTTVIAKINPTTGEWELSPETDGVSIDPATGAITLSKDAVKDGTAVTAKGVNNAGVSATGETNVGVVDKDTSKADAPTANAEPNGDVTIQRGADNKELSVSYTPTTGTAPVTFTARLENGEWKLYSGNPETQVDANIAEVDANGDITLKANAVKDGTEVIAVGTDNAGNKSSDLPDTEKAKSTTIAGVADSTPETADAPTATAKPNGDVTIAKGGDNKAVAVAYTDNNGAEKTITAKIDPTTGNWKFEPAVDTAIAEINPTTGEITLKAGAVKDGTEVNATGSNNAGKTSPATDTAKAVAGVADSTPETADAPTATAQTNGDVTIAKGGDNKAVEVAYTDNNGAEKTITAKIDPTTGNWKLEPAVADSVATVDPATGEITLKADAVKDGTAVSATGKNNRDVTAEATPVTANIPDNTPNTVDRPTVTPNNDGSVTITRGADNKTLAVTYHDESKAEKTITAKLDHTGTWKLYVGTTTEEVATNIATVDANGNITLAKDSVQDGRNVKAVGTANNNATAEHTASAKVDDTATDNQTADAVSAVYSEVTGITSITRGADNAKVVVKYTDPANADKYLVAQIDPLTGEWKLYNGTAGTALKDATATTTETPATVATINPETGAIELKAGVAKGKTQVEVAGVDNYGNSSTAQAEVTIELTATPKVTEILAFDTSETADQKAELFTVRGQAVAGSTVKVYAEVDNVRVEIGSAKADSSTGLFEVVTNANDKVSLPAGAKLLVTAQDTSSSPAKGESQPASTPTTGEKITINNVEVDVIDPVVPELARGAESHTGDRSRPADPVLNNKVADQKGAVEITLIPQNSQPNEGDVAAISYVEPTGKQVVASVEYKNGQWVKGDAHYLENLADSETAPSTQEIPDTNAIVIDSANNKVTLPATILKAGELVGASVVDLATNASNEVSVASEQAEPKQGETAMPVVDKITAINLSETTDFDPEQIKVEGTAEADSTVTLTIAGKAFTTTATGGKFSFTLDETAVAQNIFQGQDFSLTAKASNKTVSQSTKAQVPAIASGKEGHPNVVAKPTAPKVEMAKPTTDNDPNGGMTIELPQDAITGETVTIEFTKNGQTQTVTLTKQDDGTWTSSNPALIANANAAEVVTDPNNYKVTYKPSVAVIDEKDVDDRTLVKATSTNLAGHTASDFAYSGIDNVVAGETVVQYTGLPKVTDVISNETTGDATLDKVTFKGTGEVGSTVTIKNGNVELGQGVVKADGTFSIDVTGTKLTGLTSKMTVELTAKIDGKNESLATKAVISEPEKASQPFVFDNGDGSASVVPMGNNDKIVVTYYAEGANTTSELTLTKDNKGVWSVTGTDATKVKLDPTSGILTLPNAMLHDSQTVSIVASTQGNKGENNRLESTANTAIKPATLLDIQAIAVKDTSVAADDNPERLVLTGKSKYVDNFHIYKVNKNGDEIYVGTPSQLSQQGDGSFSITINESTDHPMEAGDQYIVRASNASGIASETRHKITVPALKVPFVEDEHTDITPPNAPEIKQVNGKAVNAENKEDGSAVIKLPTEHTHPRDQVVITLFKTGENVATEVVMTKTNDGWLSSRPDVIGHLSSDDNNTITLSSALLADNQTLTAYSKGTEGKTSTMALATVPAYIPPKAVVPATITLEKATVGNTYSNRDYVKVKIPASTDTTGVDKVILEIPRWEYNQNGTGQAAGVWKVVYNVDTQGRLTYNKAETDQLGDGDQFVNGGPIDYDSELEKGVVGIGIADKAKQNATASTDYIAERGTNNKRYMFDTSRPLKVSTYSGEQQKDVSYDLSGYTDLATIIRAPGSEIFESFYGKSVLISLDDVNRRKNNATKITIKVPLQNGDTAMFVYDVRQVNNELDWTFNRDESNVAQDLNDGRTGVGKWIKNSDREVFLITQDPTIQLKTGRSSKMNANGNVEAVTSNVFGSKTKLFDLGSFTVNRQDESTGKPTMTEDSATTSTKPVEEKPLPTEKTATPTIQTTGTGIEKGSAVITPANGNESVTVSFLDERSQSHNLVIRKKADGTWELLNNSVGENAVTFTPANGKLVLKPDSVLDNSKVTAEATATNKLASDKATQTAGAEEQSAKAFFEALQNDQVTNIHVVRDNVGLWENAQDGLNELKEKTRSNWTSESDKTTQADGYTIALNDNSNVITIEQSYGNMAANWGIDKSMTLKTGGGNDALIIGSDFGLQNTTGTQPYRLDMGADNDILVVGASNNWKNINKDGSNPNWVDYNKSSNTGALNINDRFGGRMAGANVNMGSGDDTVLVSGASVNNYKAITHSTIDLGEGNNRLVVANMNGDDMFTKWRGYVAEGTRITAGSGNDYVEAQALAGEKSFDSAYINLGNGNNTVKIHEEVTDQSVIAVGNDTDTVDVGHLRKYAQIYTNAGNDTVTLGGLSDSAKVYLGNGNDTLNWNFQEVTYGSGALIDGGQGYDVIKVKEQDGRITQRAGWLYDDPQINGRDFVNVEEILFNGGGMLDIHFANIQANVKDTITSTGKGHVYTQYNGQTKYGSLMITATKGVNKVDLGSNNWSSDLSSSANLKDGRGTWQHVDTIRMKNTADGQNKDYYVYRHTSAGKSQDYDVLIEQGIMVI